MSPEIQPHLIKQHQLANGIDLLLIPLANTAAVTAIVMFAVGARHESDRQRGLAHFNEHMVFKGGEKFPNSQVIAQTLDAVGGEFNAYTSQEYTGFYTKTAAAFLDTGLAVLADITLHPSFPSEEIEKEKGVIVEELNMYEDMPMRKVENVILDLVYGEAPLGRPIIGSKESVRAFKQSDFQQFKQENYIGKRCTIAVAGAIDEATIVSQLETHFGAMSPGASTSPEPAVYLDKQEGERVRIEKKDSEQTHLVLSVKGIPLNHPDRFATWILTTIFGGNMSSRLFTEVREKQGLSYYVRASTDSYTDVGSIDISAGVDNGRLALAVRAIAQEMGKLKVEMVSDEELERAKQYNIGKMLLNMEDSEAVASYYGFQHLLESKIESLPEIKEGLLKVTRDDVLRLAQQYFTYEWARLAVIGPQDDIAQLEGILKEEL